MNACPAYETDALVRKINVDRYDDREVIRTNLIESFDQLMEFGRKHLSDKFFGRREQGQLEKYSGQRNGEQYFNAQRVYKFLRKESLLSSRTRCMWRMRTGSPRKVL